MNHWHWSYFLISFGIGALIVRNVTPEENTTFFACMTWAAIIASGVALL